MANNLDSNWSRKLLKSFLKGFEANRVLTKQVDTQLFEGKFKADSGYNVDIKRPHDYNTIRSAAGDISSATKSSIISGKATATVQNYFTVAMEWEQVEEALELDQLDEILAPSARRMATDFEVDFGRYMLNNAGLSYGTPGNAVDAWSDVAGAGSLMQSIGVPMDAPWTYAMNPFTQSLLADTQTSVGTDPLVRTAWETALVRENFAGFRAMASNALASRTSTASGGDRAGAIATVTDATYVSVKDTMIQRVTVDGFTGNITVKAGDIVEVTGKHHLSLATREPIFGADGAKVKFRGVVTQDCALTSGAGTLYIAGPAINESDGQYNTVDAALADGDVITILGADGTVYQPNLFFHKQAFSIAFVKIPKLHALDARVVTHDGLSIRVHRYSDGDANTQKIRFDMLPAYGTLNPFFAGQSFGVAS